MALIALQQPCPPRQPDDYELTQSPAVYTFTGNLIMGADGGSIPDRRDLVRTKGKAEVTDKALLRELFFFCALSKVRCTPSTSHK